MLRICFVKHGSAYGADYVRILADMISRNLPEGYPGTFNCFTDDPSELGINIVAHPIPDGFTGWWAKLWLFKNGHFADGDRILYIDLDTLILGKMDEIVAYNGDFAILRDFFRPDGLQSAVMAWEANTKGWILDKWEAMGRPDLPGGDQELVEIALKDAGVTPDLWQDLYPKLFVSYKNGSYQHIPPRGASVICFHGEPKPHNCNSKWVNGVWKVDGTRAFEIEQICNTEAEHIARNLKHAVSLPYPWLPLAKKHDGSAIIVGGGPSLKTRYGEIAHRVADGGVVFSTNNTIKALRESGIEPDYQVMVDARPENAEFISGKSPALGYLLGSQCDKAVFDKVERANVTLWHPIIDGILEAIGNDPRPVHLVGGGSTVCLKAIAIAYIMGYREFYLFGMDSSYSGMEHHAYSQPLNDGEVVLDVQVDDKVFRATPWMIAQANEFQELISQLVRIGCSFNVAGDGLIPYLAKEMTQSYACATRAQMILDRLPKGEVRGAEIGVFAGEMSSFLLQRPDLSLIMVDAWDGAVYSAEDEDFHARLSAGDQVRYREIAMEITDYAKDRRTVVAKESAVASQEVRDGSLDFVFIDADHSYDGCSRDLRNWFGKVKPGGLFSGHDYANPDYPSWGVKDAVDEFAKSHGLEVTTGENFTWFTTKPLALEAAA